MLRLLIGVPLIGLATLLATGLRVRRYSRTHVVGRLTVHGRGLYFSRTPDGSWWALRLRSGCRASVTGSEPEDPPGAGTREPRRPRGPQPLTAAAER